MTNTKKRSPRRTAAQWHYIVEAQQTSGLSAPKFCREKDISYSSFMNWKKKLTAGASMAAEQPPTFIELTPELDSTTSTASARAESQPVCIELDLGAGIQLRISRPS